MFSFIKKDILLEIKGLLHLQRKKNESWKHQGAWTDLNIPNINAEISDYSKWIVFVRNKEPILPLAMLAAYYVSQQTFMRPVKTQISLASSQSNLVFAVHLKKPSVLGYPVIHWDSDTDLRLCWAHIILLVLPCWDSLCKIGLQLC